MADKAIQYIAISKADETPEDVVRTLNSITALIIGVPLLYATEDECYAANRAAHPPKSGTPAAPLRFIKVTVEESDTPERTD